MIHGIGMISQKGIVNGSEIKKNGEKSFVAKVLSEKTVLNLVGCAARMILIIALLQLALLRAVFGLAS